MIRSILNLTDSFLFGTVVNIFKRSENKYEIKGLPVDITQELINFESSPLTCVVACDTKFESNIKLQLKLMLGIFFVSIPLLGFSTITYFLSFEYSYAFILTFIIAMLATSRLDEIAKRYVISRRVLHTSH